MKKWMYKIIGIFLRCMPMSFLKGIFKQRLILFFVRPIVSFMLPSRIFLDDVILILNKKDVVMSGMLSFGLYERGEIKVFRNFLRTGMYVVDVGANNGYYTCVAAKSVGPYGHVYAFEPEEDNFQLLSKNIAENNIFNVTLVQKGLTNYVGESDFFLSSEDSSDHQLFR